MSKDVSRGKISEKLIVSDLGYLKIPQPVKDKYGTPTKYPNPDWYIEKDENNLILIYKFNKKEIESLQTKKGE